METYSGLPAESIGFREFCRFVWAERTGLLRYLRWVGRSTRQR